MGEPGLGEAVGDVEEVAPDEHPSWASFVERVVADVRTNFGSPVANEIAGVLDDHRGEAEASIRGPLGDEEERVATESDRREAAELVRDAVHNWRVARTEAEAYADGVREAAELDAEEMRRAAASARVIADAELERLRAEIATLRGQMDDLQAPLDAREAELVAWEVELTERAGALRTDTPRASQPAAPATEVRDRGYRTQWRAAAPPDPGGGRRGWGQRAQSYPGKRGPSR